MKVQNLDEKVSSIINDRQVFMDYFKARYPAFNNSNIFSRDLQYAVKRYLEFKGFKADFKDAGLVAAQVAATFVNDGTFLVIDGNTFRLKQEAVVAN